MNPKPWWQSKGIWLGILGALLVIAQILSLSGVGTLPDAWIKWIALAGLVLAGLNRYLASVPIAGSPGDKSGS